MEDIELTPEGVSPEPEPAQPAGETAPEAAEQAAAEVAPEVAPEADSPAAEETAAEAAVAGEAPDAGAEAPISVEELMGSRDAALDDAPALVSQEDAQLRAVLEAIIYVADEPLTLAQIAASLQQPTERIKDLLDQLIAEFDQPGHGIAIREVAGGYKMATKPEHHEGVRNFVKSLKPPLKLSLPALETLAVIAYKQPATGPEIMEIRGVQGGGVFKTLLDRKLIAVAGRKNVIGKPILYKTTKEFLIQFGLKDLSELPSLKEFEEIRRMAFSDIEPPAGETVPDSDVKATTEEAVAELEAAESEPVIEPTAVPPQETPEPSTEPVPQSEEN
jgi:segregation and condensation protein B